ncbi:MAG TPA: 1-deoxy-D-xylulose-5-phosphate reductoisomerase [Acidimicrobiia bacterium]|jgi:1-deoxy-D-xylulose-5-phosphate reductoisomerase|nr:1-deoxy-D-xylulose-5-phosphate reductoisomerase [Acidimicrobiales bacterium]RUA22797.1 MAG: 1-deoxy-D-xylulose-5-phosphate reductoisomerase [Actinomycetota bacterium]HBL07883.1 1-deoxy-D-xylulose-5-phosphate reductoisomerase [Acidimicrobiaceae bacterium]HIM65524.1 1-deoxy-D-xylulose-5-phosphate reductoisomerase [Acidimicrobiia bacterium]HIM84801.1 1-deoxy-D-xylulose-5-phosphate reductoisomerase [Acidimicrobiia bacterium]
MPATSVAVLGSTGSIGTQTLDIIAARPDEFDVVALGAARSVDQLVEQAEAFRPQVVAVADPVRAAEVAARLPVGTEVLAGSDALADAARSADVVVNGVVGFAGLPVTLAALTAGRRLGLANKESLIAAGPVVRSAWSTPGAELLPVDSEHCAIHQCLRANDVGERVAGIVLTASGGPFRGMSPQDLASVTVDGALAHPTWSMGPKVTVDSSTLMNKGLEVIEAHELFGVDYDDIDVVVHPQSIVHSMVTFSDGATVAQLSHPDMRLCIGYTLSYPDRLDLPFGAIDWADAMRLDFEPPDRRAFPCLDLAFAAGRMGETAPAWLSAANEVAVEAFLAGELAWVGIAEVLTGALEAWPGGQADGVEAVLDADRRARVVAHGLVADRS